MRALLLAATAALTLGGCERATQVGNNSAEPAAAGPASDATIADQLGKAAESRRFIEAVRVAGLEPTLAGPAPYTVLAPVNAAFDKLPAGALDTLMKPDGRPRLVALLTTHVLPGAILAEDIGNAIERGGGKTALATMAGGTLTATQEGDTIVLTDSAGGRARLTRADQQSKNGVVHSVDSLLTPG